MKGSSLKKAAPRQRHGPPKTNGKLCSSPPKVRFQEPIGHVLPHSLQNFRWNVEKVERKLQEKIQEKTKIAGNFVYQQAYRLLECTRGEGIGFPSFREQLRIKFGIILDDNELQLLFDKYDEDRNGTIDLNEFIRRVLPPDYNYGRQWFELSQQESEEKQARLKRESRNEFLSGIGAAKEDIHNMGETSNWTLETLMKQIQLKVVQKTPSGDDQYRRAFKMLRSGRDQGIRIKELRNNLKTKFGIFISEKQMLDLFSQFDIDGSGEIDLKEFLQFVEPPAYPGNSKVPSGLWTGYDSDEEDPSGHGNDGDAMNPSHSQTQSKAGLYGVKHEHNSMTNEPSFSGGANQTHAKKERPKSANPKKTAMLQQRRKMEQAMSRSAAQLQEAGSLHPGSKAKEALQRRHSAMSLAEHQGGEIDDDGDAHVARAKYAHRYDDDLQANAGGRPRSAGSVRSSRASSVSSTGSSVRGAAYLKRPSTPQFLRQKCLESRLANATVEEVLKVVQRMKKRASQGQVAKAEDGHRYHPVSGTPGKRNASAAAGERRYSGSDVASVYSQETTSPQSQPCNCTSKEWQIGQQRHASPKDTSAKAEAAAKHVDDEYEYEAPRVVKVHPKQQDVRPFSQGGRVLRRSKVASAGVR